ncbi:MAG: hypothetical protein Q8N56_00975 [bacterium]|nr:hypothetical protein [bacterium]
MPIPALINKITKKGKIFFLAYDQGLEYGPDDLPGKAVDPDFILQIASKGGYNGVILQKGVAERYYPPYKKKFSLILKLNGKTELSGGDPLSQQVCSVKEAKRLGAKAVGYTIYPGSKYESIMMKEFGKIVEEAHQLKLPAIAWVYPRGRAIKNETSPDTVAYAARVGLELGADVVKIKYCGSKQGFAEAIRAAGKAKVVMAGGPKAKGKDFLEAVKNAMEAGAIGVAVGRNVWQSKNPLEISKKIKEIVFGNH